MGSYRINRLKLGIVAALVMILAIVMAAPQAQAAAFWKAKYITFSATAGETLATGHVVAFDSSTYRVWKADIGDKSLRPAVGVIGKGGVAGATVEVVVCGVISGMSYASAGSVLYLSEQAGTLTTFSGNTTQMQAIGWVLPPEALADMVSSQSPTYFISIAANRASPGVWQ